MDLSEKEKSAKKLNEQQIRNLNHIGRGLVRKQLVAANHYSGPIVARLQISKPAKS